MSRYNHWTGAPVRRSRPSRLAGRYERVSPTEREVEVYLAAHPGQKSPAVYRLRCRTCGQYIWGSGLGIGAHERGAEHSEAWLRSRERVMSGQSIVVRGGDLGRVVLQRMVRDKIDPGAIVLEHKGSEDHGVVLYVRERPTYSGGSEPEYIVHQWATAYTDGTPVKGGVMFWSGCYWRALEQAQADYAERSAR